MDIRGTKNPHHTPFKEAGTPATGAERRGLQPTELDETTGPDAAPRQLDDERGADEDTVDGLEADADVGSPDGTVGRGTGSK